MASAETLEPAPAGDKPPRLERFMRRASKVLRRGPSKRGSMSSAPEPSRSPPSIQQPTTVQPSAVAVEAPQKRPSVPIAVPTLSEAPSIPPIMPELTATLSEAVQENKVPRITAAPSVPGSVREGDSMQEEKVRALFTKYGMTLEPGEWSLPSTRSTDRVEKKVRMRVHRDCHRCQASFGADKVCGNCQHTRCKKCPRFPAKKTTDAPATHAAQSLPYELAVIVDDPSKLKTATDISYVKYHTRITGRELSRRMPVQRVRRVCHKCDTLYIGNAVECATCKHLRCAQCPRDPPKLRKYPNGYPGDVEETFPMAQRQLRKIRIHVRWTCHECSDVFIDRARSCGKCGHEKCGECPRDPPPKKKQQFDPTIFQEVEDRMRNISLSPQASAA